MTIDQLCESDFERLSPDERLLLAARFINGLTSAPRPVDESDEWTDDDLCGFTRSGSRLINRRLADAERA